uniref:Uncharacterized protein n=1 Tax=Xiphophorus maculatus TaxID=8083 RepID=A0A3B5PQA4_XIPMA
MYCSRTEKCAILLKLVRGFSWSGHLISEFVILQPCYLFFYVNVMIIVDFPFSTNKQHINNGHLHCMLGDNPGLIFHYYSYIFRPFCVILIFNGLQFQACDSVNETASKFIQINDQKLPNCCNPCTRVSICKVLTITTSVTMRFVSKKENDIFTCKGRQTKNRWWFSHPLPFKKNLKMQLRI